MCPWQQLHWLLGDQRFCFIDNFTATSAFQHHVQRHVDWVLTDSTQSPALYPRRYACHCKLRFGPATALSNAMASRTLCGDPRRTAISDRYHPPEFFVWPSQNSISQSYSSQPIYLWRFRNNSMTTHLIEDWTPPLAHRVGDWKTALPIDVTFCRSLPLQDRLYCSQSVV